MKLGFLNYVGDLRKVSSYCGWIIQLVTTIISQSLIAIVQSPVSYNHFHVISARSQWQENETDIHIGRRQRHIFRNHHFLFELQILATTLNSKNNRNSSSKHLGKWNIKSKRAKKFKRGPTFPIKHCLISCKSLGIHISCFKSYTSQKNSGWLDEWMTDGWTKNW